MNTQSLRSAVLTTAFCIVTLCCDSCTHTSRKADGFTSLRLMHSHGTQAGIGSLYPEMSSNDLFLCSDAALAQLHRADVSVQRIGISATENSLAGKVFNLDERHNGALLGQLLDYDSYGDRTLCDFEPAIRVIVNSKAGACRFDVCFSCTDIAIYRPEKIASARSLRTFHMSPELRDNLLALAQSSFPDDPELKPLYRKRSRQSSMVKVHPATTPARSTTTE